MKNLIYAKRINDSQLTGIIDVSTNPPTVFCYCSEDVASDILNSKAKSKRWDELNEKIAKCYVDENGDELSEEEAEDIDLGTIGEISASAFGWL